MHESAKMENLNVLLAQILWGGRGFNNSFKVTRKLFCIVQTFCINNIDFYEKLSAGLNLSFQIS